VLGPLSSTSRVHLEVIHLYLQLTVKQVVQETRTLHVTTLTNTCNVYV